MMKGSKLQLQYEIWDPVHCRYVCWLCSGVIASLLLCGRRPHCCDDRSSISIIYNWLRRDVMVYQGRWVALSFFCWKHKICDFTHSFVNHAHITLTIAIIINDSINYTASSRPPRHPASTQKDLLLILAEHRQHRTEPTSTHPISIPSIQKRTPRKGRAASYHGLRILNAAIGFGRTGETARVGCRCGYEIKSAGVESKSGGSSRIAVARFGSKDALNKWDTQCRNVESRFWWRERVEGDDWPLVK